MSVAKLAAKVAGLDPSYQTRKAVIGLGGDEEAVDPYSGMPLYPDYIGLEDQKNLLNKISLNQGPAEAYLKEAQRNGPSRYAELAGKQQNLLSMEGANQAAKAAGGANASARTALAMRGGLTSGAAENIEKSGRDAMLESRQKVMSDKAKNMLAIGQQDEQNRLGFLANAPAVALGQANFELGKTREQAGLSDKQNAFNLSKYGSQMQAWGAGKQADATANSGKK